MNRMNRMNKETNILGVFPSWNKVKTIINPKNFNVPDYSNKGDFNTSYSLAKKSGEKEFMWNNKRFNTKYAGTPRQEVGRYGVDGKKVNYDIDDYIFINYTPPFKTINMVPGHISGSVSWENYIGGVDYHKEGNYGISGENVYDKSKSYYSYTPDDDWYNFVDTSLKLTDSGQEASDSTNHKNSKYNLFFNNCADNICDAMGIKRSKDFLGISTPTETINKIKQKYPTLEVTGRTVDDYKKLAEKMMQYSGNNLYKEKILNNANYIIGLSYSPDLKYHGLSEKMIKSLQNSLKREGYNLSKSIKQDGTFDGIFGDETKKALIDWQSKNTFKKNKLIPKKQ